MIQTDRKLIAGVTSFHCGYRNEISCWVIKCQVNTTRNEIIRKEKTTHVFISTKYERLALTEWAVFLGAPLQRNIFHFAHNVDKISLMAG